MGSANSYASATPVGTDLVNFIDDPAGVWAIKTCTINDLLALGGGGLTMTGTKTAAYTLAVNDLALVDSNGAAGDFAVQLPASPSAGDKCGVILITDHATRKVTIDRNGSNVFGGTDTTMLDLALEGDLLLFTYAGGDCGWYVQKHLRPHCAHVRRSTAQTISRTTFTKIQLATEDSDVGGCFDAATNYRFTVRRAGKYMAVGSWSINTGDTGDHITMIYKNGAEEQRTRQSSRNNSQHSLPVILEGISLVAGDYLELYVYYNGTNATENTQTTTGLQPRFMVKENN